MSEIKSRTVNSLKWSSIEKLGQFSIQLVISVILARLLGPQEYAIIGILNIFISIATVLVDAGFSQGLIRKPFCTKEDYNAVFWFNLLMSLCLYGLLFFLMPLIVRLFHEPDLLWTGRVLLLMIPVQALNVVQTTIVNKELNFKKIAKYTLLVTPLAGLAGILLALAGFGVWALIGQTLIYAVLSVAVFWWTSQWKPSLNINFRPVRELLGFSLRLAASSLLTSVFNNLFTFIIARLYPSRQLGLYTQAQKYATMPTNLIDSILNRMTYPIFVTLQNDLEQYRNLYRKMQTAMLAFILPLMTGLLLCAHEGIILVLGQKWAQATLFFQILCLAGVTLPFHPLAMSNLKVFGRSDIIFNLEILKKVLIVVAIAVGYLGGITGLVWGQTIYMWVVLLINLYYGGRMIGYRLSEQLKDWYPYFVLIIMALLITGWITLFVENPAGSLLLKIVLFGGIYMGGFWLVKIPQFALIQTFIKSRL